MNRDYITKMGDLLGLGKEFELFIKSYECKPLAGLRVNSIKIPSETFLSITPFNLEKIPWCPTGFLYNEMDKPGKHPFHDAGLYYIQEPSAMAVAELMPVEKGDKILDLCAAPGGKSTQIAAKMQGDGVLVSNEINSGRARILARNIERMGIQNCIVTSERPNKLEVPFNNYFDKILVDAPCSGEGMFRKNPETISQWCLDNVLMCADRQLKILKSADKMLKAGGILIYSTCTFSPEENEDVINIFIKEKDYEILKVTNPFFSPGKPEWSKNGGKELENTIRIWPQRVKGEGHFIAVLRKHTNKGLEFNDEDKKKTVTVKIPVDFLRFCTENLNIEEGHIIKYEDKMYKIIDPKFLHMKNIRFLNRAFYLGDLKKNRFEPSHGLALSLKKEEVRQYNTWIIIAVLKRSKNT